MLPDSTTEVANTPVNKDSSTPVKEPEQPTEIFDCTSFVQQVEEEKQKQADKGYVVLMTFTF